MKRIITFVMAMMLSLAVLANPSTIRPSIQENMDNVIAILSEKDYAPNSAELYNRLDEELADIIDYHSFGKKILAKHARKLSNEEISKFATATKQKLFRLYIGIALGQENFRYKIVKVMVHSRKDTLAKVDVELGTTPIKVVYYMSQGKDGVWKIYNIGAEGINFGLLLRDQFNDLVRKANNLNVAMREWERS